MNRKIRIAVPNKGRLRDPCLQMLETVGIQIQKASRSYITETTDPRFEIVFARSADVPIYVHYGAIDLGMTGYDLIIERNVDVFELLDLGFGKCRLVIAAPDKPNGDMITRNSTIPRVVTEFPNLSRQYFERMGTQTEILEVHGAVELAPRLGLAEYIMDITETGETLRKNGLQVIDTVLESSCRLISNKISYRIFENEINDLITMLSISRSENT